MGIRDCHWGQQDSEKIPTPESFGWNTDSSGVVHLIHVTGVNLKRLILPILQTFSTSFPHFLIINSVLITSKLSAENKSKGLSEAFVLISSASNSFPTSKFPITSSSPRADQENKLRNRSSTQASFHHVEAPENLLEMFITKNTRLYMITRKNTKANWTVNRLPSEFLNNFSLKTRISWWISEVHLWMVKEIKKKIWT